MGSLEFLEISLAVKINVSINQSTIQLVLRTEQSHLGVLLNPGQEGD